MTGLASLRPARILLKAKLRSKRPPRAASKGCEHDMMEMTNIYVADIQKVYNQSIDIDLEA